MSSPNPTQDEKEYGNTDLPEEGSEEDLLDEAEKLEDIKNDEII